MIGLVLVTHGNLADVNLAAGAAVDFTIGTGAHGTSLFGLGTAKRNVSGQI